MIALIGGLLLAVILFVTLYKPPASDDEEPYADEWVLDILEEELEEE